MTTEDGRCWLCGQVPDIWYSQRHRTAWCEFMAHMPYYLQMDLGSGELEAVALESPPAGWIRGNPHEFMIPAVNKIAIATVFKEGYYGHTIQDAYLRFG